VVVCERYTDATEAYQGYGRGLSLIEIRQLNRIATGGLRPDLTFLLDVPVARGLAAARALEKQLSKSGDAARGGDRMERQSPAFHRKVRAGYLALARREPRRFHVIAWGGTVEEVHGAIVARVGRLEKDRGLC
jgi:dTMP kinase